MLKLVAGRLVLGERQGNRLAGSCLYIRLGWGGFITGQFKSPVLDL